MSQSPQRSEKPPRTLPFITWRISEGSVYLWWLVAIIVLLTAELELLTLTFLTPQALALWEGLTRFLPIPRHFVFLQLNPVSYLWLFVLILLNYGLTWCIYYIGKFVVLDFLEWKRFSHARQLRRYKSMRQQLAYLYMLARFENERIWSLRRPRKLQTGAAGSDSLFTFAEPLGTIQAVGPFSWFYLRLSNYLFPPAFPEQARTIARYVQQMNAPGPTYTEPVEDNQRQPLEEEESQDQQGVLQVERDEKQRSGCLYLFTPQVNLFLGTNEQIPLRIKSSRQLELLIYLAVKTGQEVIQWDDIVANVFEWRYPGKNVEELHEKLHKDAAQLRELFEKALRKAGLPYADPIPTEGRGLHTIWRLADAYEAVDLIALETFYRQELEAIRKGREIDLQRFRDLCETVVGYYQNGFLTGLLRKAQVGDWAKKCHSQYREMYWRILWEAAEYEYTLGKSAQREEQHRWFSQAAQLYQRYALETASATPVGQEGPTQLGEYTFGQAMHLYHLTGNHHSARRVHHEYIARIKRRFPDWKPEPQTEQIWREITQEEGKAYYGP